MSTILGIVGGLSTALQILILPIVKLVRRIYYYYCRRHKDNHHKTLITFHELQRSIQTINVYHEVRTTHLTENSQTRDEILLIQRQQIAARSYILFFILALIIIITFTSLNSQTHSMTISFPSESIFEQLQIDYLSSLSCPCSQIAIQYSKFLSINPIAYHQICSSYFISSDFIELLWGSESLNSYYWIVDMKILSTQFRLLASFCSLAKDIIKQKIEVFSSRELISIETLTRRNFQIQINSIIDHFMSQVPTDFRRIHNYIIEVFHANQLHNIFFTNWNLDPTTFNDNYIMSTHPILYNNSNSSCSCTTTSTCSRSILTYNNKREVLSGLVLGCLPIYGLHLSTFECLYNSTCLWKLFNLINSEYNISSSLNTSIYSRFMPISSVVVGTLIDELFIEAWKNESNYSNYFSICAPLTCRYTYTERNDFLYILATFLGLYGGLTIGLKFVIWYIIDISVTVQERFDFR
ncbi:unnamed protein product [Rotaria sp. Silwood2]|nr:unnamed protein product [Rotaria sp. Silwood2]CAF2849726.1 unnamed protein product [Rotaria sp. Silwood2]CAF3136428.1 unnamed protein product [Rotaria sp. Silwood2]CAF4141648.1 unnamed protein product [Rotaria sp. Silwood2]CAF4243377.1 unnamed protein product [Rotaria sp. Silwood2]